MNSKARLIFILCVLSLVLGACARNISEENWSDSLPDRKIFVQAHEQQQAEGSNDQSLKKHLMWVKRFYHGSAIYPIGWNHMTATLLKTVDTEQERKDLAPRMRALGQAICTEWLKNHNTRNINSTAIAIWGNALRTASKKKHQSEFVEKVENDVAQLLAGTLAPSAIKRERYYPPENFDNF